MVAFGGILVKIGSLAIRTLAKPVSKAFVTQSKNHPVWRSMFVRYGQFHHRVQYKFQARLLGHRVRTVKPIDEDKALELGADAISEFMIFGVAGLCISLEVYRNLLNSEESRKAEEHLEVVEKQALQDRFDFLEQEIARLQEAQSAINQQFSASIDELRRRPH
uniref:OPA3-like protein n=1 Tax=Spongospora subterranea TaxID=70186 RepID=A0A0H5QRU2_9EUKA|eukprot:CRZ04342.1 hypothetical protein [Spongospora subterranea]